MRLRLRIRTGGAGAAGEVPFGVRIVESCVNATNETNITLRITGVEVGDSVDWSVGAVNGNVVISSVPELVTGVDLSSLGDGTLTVSGLNNTTSDTSTSTKTKDTVSPSGYAVVLSNPLGFTEISTQAKLDFTGLEVDAVVNWIIERFIFESVSGSFVASAATESLTVDVSSLSDGNLQAKCTLTDACGNVGSQASSAVVVKDSVAPSGYSIDAITDPINNQNQTNIQIDFVGLEIGATAFWSITDGVTTINDDFVVSSISESIFEDVSTLNNGTLTVSLVLVDTAGNQGAIVSATTNKQVFTPSGYSVAFDAASYDGTTGLNAAIDISGANVGNSYSLTITSSGGGTPIVYTGTVGAASFTISNIDLTTLNTGTGTATYFETDAFGNIGGDANDTADFVFFAYDPDYQAILDYATLQGDTLPSTSVQDVQNQLVLELKNANLWTKFTNLHVWRNSEVGLGGFKSICWKRLIKADYYNSPILGADGIQGDGVSAYVDIKYDCSLESIVNDYSFGFWSNTGTLTNLRSPMGVLDGGATAFYLNGKSSIRYFLGANSNSIQNNIVYNNDDELQVVTSNGANAVTSRNGISQFSNGITTPATPSGTMFLLARQSGGGAISISNDTLSFSFNASFLTLSECLQLSTILTNYFAAL